MIKSRHKAREAALQILYRMEVAAQNSAAGSAAESSKNLIRELQSHFEHFQVPEGLREYAAQLVAGTLQHQAAIDAILEKHAANWKVARMGFVDRSLLRMATYEMLHLKDVPPTVVIDEAIELGKQFGTADTPGFVNGILDAIHGSIKSGALATSDTP